MVIKENYEFVKDLWDGKFIMNRKSDGIEVDLTKTVKNARESRANYLKVWQQILELLDTMDFMRQEAIAQKKFFDFIKDSPIWEDYSTPEYPKLSGIDYDEFVKGLEDYKKSESERIQKSISDLQKEKESNALADQINKKNAK